MAFLPFPTRLASGHSIQIRQTTLLAAWREAEAARKPVAWLTLDEGDDDPVVLWSYDLVHDRACGA